MAQSFALRVVSVRATLMTFVTAACLLFGFSTAVPVAQAQTVAPGSGINHHSSIAVQMLDASGQPAADQAHANVGQVLQYSLHFTLAGSVNLASVELVNTNDALTDGYGQLVSGSIIASAAANPDSVISTDPRFDASHVSVPSDPGSLAVAISADQTSQGYTGIADGNYTVTYQVKITKAPATTQTVTSHSDATLTSIDGKAVTNKDAEGQSDAAIVLVAPITNPQPSNTSSAPAAGSGNNNQANPGHTDSENGASVHTGGTTVAGASLLAIGLIGIGLLLIAAKRRRDDEEDVDAQPVTPKMSTKNLLSTPGTGDNA